MWGGGGGLSQGRGSKARGSHVSRKLDNSPFSSWVFLVWYFPSVLEDG